jgi:hypothetical protein
MVAVSTAIVIGSPSSASSSGAASDTIILLARRPRRGPAQRADVRARIQPRGVHVQHRARRVRRGISHASTVRAPRSHHPVFADPDNASAQHESWTRWIRRGVLNARRGRHRTRNLTACGPKAALVGALLQPGAGAKLAATGPSPSTATRRRLRPSVA